MITFQVPYSLLKAGDPNQKIYYTISSYSGNSQQLAQGTGVTTLANYSSKEVPSLWSPFSIDLSPGHYLGVFYTMNGNNPIEYAGMQVISNHSPNVTQLTPCMSQGANGQSGYMVYPFHVT